MTDIIAQLEVEKSTLRSTIVEKDGLIAQQGSVIVEKDGLIATYKQQLAELRRMIYGTKSERVSDEAKPDEAAAADQNAAVQTEDGKLVDEPADTPSKKPRRKPTKADEINYPDDIEVVRRVHEPHESLRIDAEGRLLKKVSEQIVRKLAYRARKAYLIEDVYPIYASHETNAEFVQAPASNPSLPAPPATPAWSPIFSPPNAPTA